MFESGFADLGRQVCQGSDLLEAAASDKLEKFEEEFSLRACGSLGVDVLAVASYGVRCDAEFICGRADVVPLEDEDHHLVLPHGEVFFCEALECILQGVGHLFSGRKAWTV